MKKLICILSILMAATCMFAAGAKWKSSDIFYQKKLDKLIETYNLTKTYDNNGTVLYKNEETSDYIYITKLGSEENNDKRTFLVSFAILGGVFDSCTVYGAFTDFSYKVKYMYSYINESNTTVAKDDFTGKTTYGWNNPQWVFYIMFFQRVICFQNMTKIVYDLDITIPDDIVDRYDYFAYWLAQNNNEENVHIKLGVEYKNYLKEHK